MKLIEALKKSPVSQATRTIPPCGVYPFRRVVTASLCAAKTRIEGDMLTWERKANWIETKSKNDWNPKMETENDKV